MSNKRFAVHFNSAKTKKWSVVTQMKFLGFWQHLYTQNFSSGDAAQEDWEMNVQREFDRRKDDGDRKTEWRP